MPQNRPPGLQEVSCAGCPWWLPADPDETKGTCWRFPPAAPRLRVWTLAADACAEHPFSGRE